jgi:cytochrome b involved in lipid metabolism
MDLIFGLPLHPLINHVVAVLTPLSAIGVVLLILTPKWRGNYSLLLLISIITSAIAGVVAENSGEALSNRVGYPGDHAIWGERLSKVILALALLYITWYLIEKGVIKLKSKERVIKGLLNTALVVVAIVSAILTVIVGHLGAKATWQNRIAASSGQALTDLSSQDLPKSTDNQSTALITLSKSEIAKHNLKADSWSIINGKVFNLTPFVQNHPGGSAVISNICGKDGSGAFTNQHGSSGKPNAILNSLLLGEVGAQISKEQSTAPSLAPNSNFKGGSGDGERDRNKDRDEDGDKD